MEINHEQQNVLFRVEKKMPKHCEVPQQVGHNWGLQQRVLWGKDVNNPIKGSERTGELSDKLVTFPFLGLHVVAQHFLQEFRFYI